MRVISVDDEEMILEDFVELLNTIDGIEFAKGFTSCQDSLDYIRENNVDVAFLDINMQGMDGITLAKQIKLIKPEINIIFLTAHGNYSLEAMKIHASGYLLKPPLKDDVEQELKDLRKPVEKKHEEKIYCQCFGNFEVYIDKIPCKFKYVKTKELLAYLIDRRGANCTNGEIIGALWEDKEVTISLENYLRNLVSDLKNVLRRAGLDNLIIKKKGMICIVPEMIECDYYRWLKGDISAINSFNGEYMSQYSWAEGTLAGLSNI